MRIHSTVEPTTFHPHPKHHRFIDMTGLVFGRLTVLGFSGVTKHHGALWCCRCECGCFPIVHGASLKAGYTNSCGCLQREIVTKHRMTPRLHYLSEYAIWVAMKQRCENPNAVGFSYYGGRGIKVCERWRDFLLFLEDVGYRPSPLHTLDRFPDPNGNYEPKNCRWATKKEQARNRRSNRLLTHNGKTATIAEWSDITGINDETIRCRLNRYGWSVAEALTTPPVPPCYRHGHRKHF